MGAASVAPADEAATGGAVTGGAGEAVAGGAVTVGAADGGMGFDGHLNVPAPERTNDAAPSDLLSGGGAGSGRDTAGPDGSGGAVSSETHRGSCGEYDDDDDDAPSELLGPLLEEWPDLMRLVLACLDPTDCALLARVGNLGNPDP